MSSKSRATNAFLNPQDNQAKSSTEQHRVKQVNVYEAVAGKISSQGFIPRHRVYASTRDTPSSSSTAVAPENVLYRRNDAPTRYAESDVYFANEKKNNLNLPDSDLLKAVHAYTSDFYTRQVKDATGDFKSMDETALLAFGILLEESGREILGRTGDLVFTEGEEIALEQSSPVREWRKTRKPKAKRRRLNE